MTRRTGFLWQSALAVGLVIIAAGSLASLLHEPDESAVARMFELTYLDTGSDFDLEPATPSTQEDEIHGILVDCLDADHPFDDKLEELQLVIWMLPDKSSSVLPAPAEVPNLSSNEYAIASAFEMLCREEAADRFQSAGQLYASDAGIRLRTLAAEPVEYAGFALSLVLRDLDPEAAGQALLREIEGFNNEAMRDRLIRLYLDNRQYDEIEALKRDPRFASGIDPSVEQNIALSRMDWSTLVRTLIPAAYEDVNPAMVFLALVAGAIWAVILLRFNGAISFRAAPVRLALPALLLGALSAHATILFIFWQEHQLGLGMGSDVMGQFVYSLGIGFREEGLKLLFFCPLLPFLWRRSDLEILTVAGLVGLGFAIEENINYFAGSAGLSALGRFATANFMHISLTALGGLTLARACIHRRARDLQQAGITFASIVAFHGLYDAFLIVDLLADSAWLSMTVFIVMSYQYFGWLRHLRDEWKDPVSITSVFTLGLVVVTGLSYCLYAWEFGMADAFNGVVSEVLGIAVILIMFYREIPETIHS